MKNLAASLMLIIFMTICPETNSKPFHTNNVVNSFENFSVINDQSKPGRKNKDGSYRRKKGFMWGLFKKKSSCDCPKH